VLINLLIIGFTLLGVRSILYEKDGVEKTFIWILWAFCLGYRTFSTIPMLVIHPIEIFSFTCIIRLFSSNHYRYRRIPMIHRIILFLFFIVFVVGVINDFSPYVLNDFKAISLLYQFYFISQYIKFDQDSFFRIIKHYFIPAVYISLFGVIEYYNPTISSSIFGFDKSSQHGYEIIDQRMFGRLAFMFWGTHLAANVIPPIFPILFYLKVKKNWIINNNFIFSSLIFLFLITIYLSGNRVSWLIITLMLFNFIFIYSNSLFPNVKKYILLISISFILTIYSLPATYRYFSIFKALTGNIDATYDASSAKRLGLIKYAFTDIKNNFMGVGWGEMWWVHSDILQITAAAGIIPGFLFILSLLLIFIRTIRYHNFIRNFSDNNYEKLSVFICLNFILFVTISLIFNGNYGLVQCGAPIFILWVISDSYVRASINNEKIN